MVRELGSERRETVKITVAVYKFGYVLETPSMTRYLIHCFQARITCLNTMLSKNSKSADNQQVSKCPKISDDYFAGFIDGEGCFYIGFNRRPDLPLGWQVITEFHLSQNPKGLSILKAYQKRLGCGIIKPNHRNSRTDKTFVYVIKRRSDLINRLLPFFRSHTLHSKKQDIIIFSKVLELISSGRHLNKSGFIQLLNLVYSRRDISRKKYSRDAILESLQPQRLYAKSNPL